MLLSKIEYKEKMKRKIAKMSKQKIDFAKKLEKKNEAR